MPVPLQNIIVGAMALPGTKSVELRWANGAVTLAQFDDVVGHGVFAHLADPNIFAQVRVAEGGYSLEWPGDVDFSADALWFDAHPEDNPWAERSQAAE